MSREKIGETIHAVSALISEKTGIDWKERTRRSNLSNLITREQELDREISKLRPFSRVWWRKVDRAGELRTSRIELEAQDPSRVAQEEDRKMAIERILIRCWRHTKPGELIAARVLKMGSDRVAACPKCIEEGTKLRDVAGVELSLEAMGASLEDLGKTGSIPKPTEESTVPTVVVSPEPTLDEIRRAHDTRRSLPPDPVPPGPPPVIPAG